MLKAGQRPLRACAKICCRFKANARLQAAAQPVGIPRRDRTAPAPAPRTPKKKTAQASLF
jgi:hypothetical protein